MKILSIDWDYFIDATYMERHLLFPDSGRDCDFGLGNAIWSLRYSQQYEDMKVLEDVNVKYIDYAIIEYILESQFEDIPVLLADSHKHLYKFIEDLKEEYDPKQIDVFNIDFHHDYYNRQKDINCGNWLRRCIENKLIDTVFWVLDKESDTKFELNTDIFQLPIFTKVEDLDNLRDINFDAVFICKSSMWSPPHLDRYFIHLIKNLKFKNILKKDFLTLDKDKFHYCDIDRFPLMEKNINEITTIYPNTGQRKDVKNVRKT